VFVDWVGAKFYPKPKEKKKGVGIKGWLKGPADE
jgi:hypothetical protein